MYLWGFVFMSAGVLGDQGYCLLELELPDMCDRKLTLGAMKQKQGLLTAEPWPSSTTSLVFIFRRNWEHSPLVPQIMQSNVLPKENYLHDHGICPAS